MINVRTNSIFNISVEDEEVIGNSEVVTGDSPSNGILEYDTTEAIEYLNKNEDLNNSFIEAQTLAKEGEELDNITSDMEDSVNEKEELVETEPESVTEDTVAVAQEEFCYYLGKLSKYPRYRDVYNIDYLVKNRLSIESDGTPLQMYMVSIESFKEVVKAVTETVANIIQRIIAMVTKMRVKLMVMFGDYSKEAERLISKMKDDKDLIVMPVEYLNKLEQNKRDIIKNSLGIYIKLFNGFTNKEIENMQYFAYSNISLDLIKSLVNMGKDIINGISDPKDQNLKAESLVEIQFIKCVKAVNRDRWVESLWGQPMDMLKGLCTGIVNTCKKLALAVTPDVLLKKFGISNVVGNDAEGNSASDKVEELKVQKKILKNTRVAIVVGTKDGIEPYSTVMTNLTDILVTSDYTDSVIAAIRVITGISNDSLNYFELNIPKDRSDMITSSKLIFKTGTMDISKSVLNDVDKDALTILKGDNSSLQKLLQTVADFSRGVKNKYDSITGNLSDLDKVLNELKNTHIKKEDGSWGDTLELRNAYSSYMRGIRCACSSLLLNSMREYVNFSKKAIQFSQTVLISKEKVDEKLNTDNK